MKSEFLAFSQTQPGITASQFLDCKTSFKFGEVGAEAVVKSKTECEMLVRVWAPRIELLRQMEDRFVSPGGRKP